MLHSAPCHQHRSFEQAGPILAEVHMRKLTFLLFSLSFVVLFAGISPGRSAEGMRTKSKPAVPPASVTTNDYFATFLINSLFNYYSNNGYGSQNPVTSNSALEFPRGSGRLLVYTEGLLWGGKHSGSVKVGGSSYRSGLQAGRLLTSGNPPGYDDPTPAKYRLYRVRPDVSPAQSLAQVKDSLSVESVLIGRFQTRDETALYNQYVSDWNEWPASSGAPFMDNNANDTYDPAVDTPGIPGASQTLWHVSNDGSASRTNSLYGSAPIGLEVQRTIWGYAATGVLSNTIFLRYRIINRSTLTVDSMFFAYFADPDIGASGDDFMGCDTTVHLGFAYNGHPADSDLGPTPPVVGYTLLQGPVVSGTPADSAWFNFGIRRGFRNLPMTAFASFTAANEPPSGNLAGTIRWYNLMRGRDGATGAPLINAVTGLPTTYPYSGDPVTGTGWLDTAFTDKRLAVCAGPLTMAPGDTQEVIVAFVASGQGSVPTNITDMKAAVRSVREFIIDRKPIVSVSTVDSPSPLLKPLVVEGSAYAFLGTVAGTSWFVAEKPAASVAPLITLSPSRVQFAPDVAGSYAIGYVAVTGSGNRDTAFARFEVPNNRAPKAQFSLDSEYTLGESLPLDGSASGDPDGSPLSYQWTVTGDEPGSWELIPGDTLKGHLLDGQSAIARYTPYRMARLEVSLTVSDGVFSSSLSKSVVVKPRRTSNVTLGKIFPWQYWTTPYFGSPIIREFNGTIWGGMGSVCALDFGPSQAPPVAFLVSSYGNFFVTADRQIFVAAGRLGAAVHQTNGSVVTNTIFIDPDGSPLSKPDTTAFEVYYKSPYLFFSYGNPGLYVYNVSNPSVPALAGRFVNGERWGTFIVAGSALIALHREGKITMLDISTPSAPSLVTTIRLAHRYTIMKQKGSLFCFALNDSVAIYDFTGTPLLLSEFRIPRRVKPQNTVHDLSVTENRLLIASSEGTYVYDLTNPSMPALMAEWLTGIPQTRTFMNTSRILVSPWDRWGTQAPERPGPVVELTIGAPSTTESDAVSIPERITLSQNYPNPFNPSTTIRYGLPQRSPMTLTVFSTLGQQVAILQDGEQGAGYHEILFDASGLSSGVYFYRMQAGSFVETRKLLLLK